MDRACIRCGEVKPLEAYYRDRSRTDGHRTRCAECDKAAQRTFEALERKRRYYHSEQGKAAEKRYVDSGKKTAAGKARYQEIWNDPERAEKRRAYNREYQRKYQARPEYKAYRKQYQERPEVQERLKQRLTEYYARPEVQEHIRKKGLIKVQTRNARKAALPAAFTYIDWERCLEFFDYRCAYCGEEKPLAQEHFLPILAGGSYTPDNIVPACKSCNSKKRTKHPGDWCTGPMIQKILAYFSTLG